MTASSGQVTEGHFWSDKRWPVFCILCCSVLMTMVDMTIVMVSLPHIRESLGFSETHLTWVVNAYLLTTGGFMLLSGRLGDHFGHRRVYLFGIVIFTLASLACGLAQSPMALVLARAFQGLGSATIMATSLALVVNLYPKPSEQARAVGIYAFVDGIGGGLGLLIGGMLTEGLSWHWIFFVNVPIGIAVLTIGPRLPRGSAPKSVTRLDVAGAVLITGAITLLVYALIDANAAGWMSVRTRGLLGSALVIFLVFLVVEAKSSSPLIPLHMFSRRNLATVSIVAILWCGAADATFLIVSLFLQQVAGYTAFEAGLAFLPNEILIAATAIGLSANLVTRVGSKWTLVGGVLLAACAFGLFSLAPVEVHYWRDILLAASLAGAGTGLLLNPLFLIAMSDAGPQDTGLTSGVINTAITLGGAVGVAGLTSLAGTVTSSTLHPTAIEGLHLGYQAAFLAAALVTGIAAIIAALFLKISPTGRSTQ